MAQQFEVDAATGKCSVTGKVFEENQEFYTVLFESGESFTRSDFSLEGWSEKFDLVAGDGCHGRNPVLGRAWLGPAVE